MKVALRIIILSLTMFCSQEVAAKIRPDSLLQKIFAYSQREDVQGQYIGERYSYSKFRLNVDKRNIALLPVPTMFAVAHSGRRTHLMEAINKKTTDSLSTITTPLVTTTTFPDHRHAMEVVAQYMDVNIYSETMVGLALLSPFNEKNRPYYRYRITPLNEQESTLVFKAKIENTQLVTGNATVENQTGRILSCSFWGDYDMLKFNIRLEPKPDEEHTDAVDNAELAAQFRFLGNKLTSFAHKKNMAPCPELDTISRKEDLWVMETYRPEEISQSEQELYDEVYDANGLLRTHEKEKSFKYFAKKILWNTIGDNLLNRVKSNFGANQEGYFRLNPLLNPLYMGYNDKKGFYHRYDLRLHYDFSARQRIMLRMKGGYSFKQKQFYYDVPVMFFYDTQHNGYIKFEAKNGNWIKNYDLTAKILDLLPDDYPINSYRIQYFKVMNWSLTVNRDVTDKLGVEIGVQAHRRLAADRAAYKAAGVPASYYSAGPSIEVQYRPLGWKGPIIVTDYERSIKGFMNSKMAFERWEVDAKYIQRLSVVKSLSYRVGFGFYTMKDNVPYFLEFTNFHENNIPGGWRDDWTGEFELLHQDFYYSSKYYLRSNVTYESPLLLLSHLPYVGKLIETERIYGSLLCVKHLWPYSEYGYGFTNKYFSMGFFVSAKELKLQGVGFKFGLELFRGW